MFGRHSDLPGEGEDVRRWWIQRWADMDERERKEEAEFWEMREREAMLHDFRTGRAPFMSAMNTPRRKFLRDQEGKGFGGSPIWPFHFGRALHQQDYRVGVLRAIEDDNYDTLWRDSARRWMLKVFEREKEIRALKAEQARAAALEKIVLQDKEVQLLREQLLGVKESDWTSPIKKKK